MDNIPEELHYPGVYPAWVADMDFSDEEKGEDYGKVFYLR